MQVTDRPVDDFLASLPDAHRADVQALDAIIAQSFAGDTRVMWEGVRWFVVGLALQKSGISLYVNAVKDGQYLGKVYGKTLGKVRIGSASVGFKRLADLDIDVFTTMIREARDRTR